MSSFLRFRIFSRFLNYHFYIWMKLCSCFPKSFSVVSEISFVSSYRHNCWQLQKSTKFHTNKKIKEKLICKIEKNHSNAKNIVYSFPVLTCLIRRLVAELQPLKDFLSPVRGLAHKFWKKNSQGHLIPSFLNSLNHKNC